MWRDDISSIANSWIANFQATHSWVGWKVIQPTRELVERSSNPTNKEIDIRKTNVVITSYTLQPCHNLETPSRLNIRLYTWKQILKRKNTPRCRDNFQTISNGKTQPLCRCESYDSTFINIFKDGRSIFSVDAAFCYCGIPIHFFIQPLLQKISFSVFELTCRRARCLVFLLSSSSTTEFRAWRTVVHSAAKTCTNSRVSRDMLWLSCCLVICIDSCCLVTCIDSCCLVTWFDSRVVSWHALTLVMSRDLH